MTANEKQFMSDAVSLREFRAVTTWTQSFRVAAMEEDFRRKMFHDVKSFAVKTWVLIWSSWVGLGLLIMFALTKLNEPVDPLVALSFLLAGGVFVAWYFIQKTSVYEKIYAWVQLSVALIIMFIGVFLVSCLPMEFFQQSYPFLFLGIVCTHITLNIDFAKVVSGGLISTLFVAAFGFYHGLYPTVAGGPFLFLGILVSANGLGISVFRYTDQQRRLQFLTSRLLDEEKKRSELLLLSIFPAKVARDLRNGSVVEPTRIDNVSVIFADLSGFTAWSLRANPRQIVDAIDAIFGSLDELAVKFGIEKIKTIGDAYMACSGLTTSTPEQTANAIAFSRLAILSVEKLKPIYFQGAPHIGLRVGIATGAVVAGVLGKIKPTYDIWGETVNLASRLESSGRSGCVTVCNRTFELAPASDISGKCVDLTLKGIGKTVAHELTV